MSSSNSSKKLKKVVTFGEVLLRLSPPDNLRLSQTDSFSAVYGGSELNVAISLASFGLPVDFVTRLPESKLAKSAVMEMHKYGVSSENIVYGGDRLGLYFIEVGAGLRGSSVVYDRQFSAMTTIEKGMINWEEVFADAQWFHWSGITAGISNSAAEVCAEAIEIAEKMGLTISTDFNYRANLWKYDKSPQEIMEPMIAKCDVVLAGEYACDQYFGIKPIHSHVHQSLAQQLESKFPKLKYIAITHREMISATHNKWSAVLYNKKEELLHSTVYDITDIVDRIGAGDSFMAGLIYGLITLDNDHKALDFAVAASALKHTIYGDANLASVEEVKNLAEGDLGGLVKR